MKPIVYIETPRLLLRDWKLSDHEPYIALNQDEKVREFFPSLRTAGQSLEDIEWFTNSLSKHGYTFFAVERKDNGQFIGFTGLYQPGFETVFTPCVEVGWRLSYQNWGQGFATEAAKACLKFGFEDLKLEEIYSFTSMHNRRSEHVMEKIGMKKEGYFDHPGIEEGHVLRKHVLYKINKH